MNHETLDDAVKGCAIVKAFLSKGLEILDGLRGDLGPELDGHFVDIYRKHATTNHVTQCSTERLWPGLFVTGTGSGKVLRDTFVAVAGYYSLDLFVDWYGGIWDAFGQVFTFPPSFSSHRFSGYSLGFSLTIPLSNRAAAADHDRAITERQLSISKINGILQQILLDVRNALTQVDMTRAKIETSELTRQLAEQRMEAERTKFDLGTSTLRFVLEEQRNVAQAQTAEVQSYVNFTKALVDLDKAMGLTLKRNNIEIDKALQPPAVASGAPVGRGAN